MTQHTKGPWVIDEDEGEDNAGQTALSITSDNRPGYICGIHCAEGVDLDSIDRGNARLIAAAPALYEALLDAQAVIGDLVRAGSASIDEIEAYSTIKEALRLAEGGKP